MELTPGIGFDPIRFGMVESDIRELLGFPSKSYERDGIRRYLYFRIQAELWFDAEGDGRLKWISCSNPNLTICGRRILGMATADALDFLRDALDSKEIDYEDFGSFESHTFENLWVELQCEYGTVRSVSFGNFFDNNDEPIWPAPGT